MAKRQRIDKDTARYALSGIEAAIEKLQHQAAELRSIVGASAAAAKAVVGGAGRAGGKGDHVPFPSDEGDSTPPHGRNRTMSADARRRISEAQKARWAKQKGEQTSESAQKSAAAPRAARSSKQRGAGKKK